MSSPATPSFGQEAAVLVQDMLLTDAALANAQFQSLVTAAVDKGLAANGDPATVIGAFQAAVLSAILMAPSFTPELFMQGLKTFKALQDLLNAYIASKLTPASPAA